MSRICLFVAFVLIASCGDDTVGENNSSNNGSNNGTNNGTTGGKKADGENCRKNVDCKSQVCEESICLATATGPRCGGIYCSSAFQCLDPLQEECGTDELTEQFLCENDGNTWCPDDAEGTCCVGAEDVCLFQKCIVPGDACDEDNPCPLDSYCEPTINKCVENDLNPNTCTFRPPIGEFEPVEAYGWSGSTVSPEYDQVMMMPAVANLTDDNGDGEIDENDIPDIVFTTFWQAGTGGSHHYGHGVLRVINGVDGSEHWSSTELAAPFEVRADSTPSIGDIDYDGLPDIIVEAPPNEGGGVYALEHNGIVKWFNADAVGNRYGGSAIANLDGQGDAEIVTGQDILSSTGESICRFPAVSFLPTIVDLDGDGKQEVIVGQTGFILTDATATDGTGCVAFSTDGFRGNTAIADTDNDMKPEIVSVEANGTFAIYDDDSSELLRINIPIDNDRLNTQTGSVIDCTPGVVCTTAADCGGTPTACHNGQCLEHRLCIPGGGPPTIADFDGDGEPEIGIAARWYYLVYETDGAILWAHKTKDFSSAFTGSSVFDFEGDGKAEVIYNDEAYLRVYSGNGSGVDADNDGFNDPEILLEEENTSGTLLEYPVIVDVDNDGSAEIVVSANDYAFKFEGETFGSKGIRVFKDIQNRWVGTRKIWNQHAYHVTNVEEDGSIPRVEKPNWLEPRLNNYRQNVQGGDLTNAPNFVSAVETDGSRCAASGFVIKFTIENKGSIGVRVGALSTTILAGKSGETLEAIETVTNQIPLGPGAVETVEYTWMVPANLVGENIDVEVRTDYDENGNGRHNECIEDDNTSAKADTLCNVIQ